MAERLGQHLLTGGPGVTRGAYPRYNYLEGKNFTQVSGACRGVGVGASNSNSDAVSLTLRPEFTVLKQDSGRPLGSGVCQRARQCSCAPFQSWTDTTELVQ